MTTRDTGLPTDKDGNSFDIPARELVVPEHVELDDGWLVWGHTEPERDGHQTKRAGITALSGFLKLENDPGPGILEFARRFGPLRLCLRHDLPVTHALALYWVTPKLSCRVRRSGDRFYERLSSWRSFAGQAAAIVRIIAALQRGDCGAAADWALLKRSPVRPVLILSGGLQSVRSDRARLVSFLNAWLAVASTQVRFKQSRGELSPYISGGLFGLIGLQLTTIFAETHGWAPCSFCFTLYPVPKGHFREGNSHLCGRVECRKQADARKSRRYRRGETKPQRRPHRSGG